MHSVLIVEDERWVRTAIKRTIERTGLPFQVQGECGNGLEALDWLDASTVDLVLADIRMPVMDGLAFARQLRERKQQASVVMITGHDDFAYAQQALRAGVFDYLLKPVETEEMKACLSKWMQQREAADLREETGGAVEEEAEPSPVEAVKAYVKANLTGDITLTEAAAKVFLNPSYLSQLFKQQTNMNFTDYVLEERIAEAKRLLCTTSLRISDIAGRLGYADLAYFSAVFKKTAGVTPSEYRKAAAAGGLLG
jgi:YesN/AraC family two-component response regulator